MIKEFIDLQRNSKATCVILTREQCVDLNPIVSMPASVSDVWLFSGKKPPFARELERFSAKNELCYFIIENIDGVEINVQDRFVGLVKDREFRGWTMPDNCIILFTVKGNKSLKGISPELYKFATCVV